MEETLITASKSYQRFVDYYPPDPEEKGLTPLQAAEREASQRRAFLLYMDAQMTPELAERVMRSNVAELTRVLEIVDEQAKDLMELARREQATISRWFECEEGMK